MKSDASARLQIEATLRRLAAEALGSLLLAAAVIGSGIMGERLASGNAAIALLANTLATVAVLAVIIRLLGPVSGGHFNSVVTFVMTLRRHIAWHEGVAYVIAQIAGCCLGALLAHAMFELPLLQAGTQARAGIAHWLAEAVATAGLILVVLGLERGRDVAWAVAAWIGAAYWFTSSTSFANPAITIARSLSDTFAGIRPVDVPPFICPQLLGSVAGLATAHALFSARRRKVSTAR
jgi:glycerol uptake facilitator-like aquaporin